MDSLPGSIFSRRSDRGGTIVSTCETCFAAVALSLRESELEKAEREHICNPHALKHWKMFINDIKSRDRKRGRSQSI